MGVKYLEYVLLMLCSLYSINAYMLQERETFMSDFLQILTVITTIAGLILTILKNAQTTNKKIDNLNIGKFKGQTLCNYLLNNFKGLEIIIGKGKDDKTLTGQHKDLQKALDKEINLIEQRYAEEEKRLMQFSSEQQNTAQAINDFKLFMASWTKTTAENNDLKIQISSLKQQLEFLSQKVNELEKQNQILKYQSHHKSDNIHSHDEMEL